jgi:DNA adenine methylase
MKTPITWYGGKQNMLQYILPIIPEHNLYTESFFGGGAVYFSKEPVKAEVINDVNKEATNFYYTVKVDFDPLAKEVTSTLHSKDAFNDAKVIYTYPHLFDNIKRAWAFYTMANQSFSSSMSSFAFDRQGSTARKVDNKAIAFTYSLADRLKRTTVENDDAVKVIMRYDCDHAFHYVDPPYFNSDCGHYSGYNQMDFERLLNSLQNVKGKFLLSSYPSPILSDFTKANKWDSWSVVKQVGIKSDFQKSKVEVLTANYPITEKLNAIRKA